MKVGILNAIVAEESRVDWQGSPVDAYVRLLRSGGGRYTVTGYDVARGDLPASPDACDAYVISGSPSGVYESDPWIAALAQFVRDAYAAGKKLVGICFGHQMLAHALGGQTVKSEKGWGLGRMTFAVDEAQPWMGGRSAICALYFVHQDQVTQLPPAAQRLGGSDFCPNALFVIGDQVLGIQGHPEFSERLVRDILTDPQRSFAPQVRETAVRSLDAGPVDNGRVARWIVTFIGG